ncbi:MAG: FGGY family carbohydrate kinase [Bacteroidia bacterium]|nr:FGGY family carbohydrate kinase [Bacteroidia bacterium]
MKVRAVFDIGKSNKKLFLFDENFQEVKRLYTEIPEIKDEDDFPCDDLAAIEKWVKESLFSLLDDDTYNIQSLNFSTYGASFVHIGKDGKALSPLYNYLKPYPEKLLQTFYDQYGDALTIARETASPPLAMLNSGLQLYWLKHERPQLYQQLYCSLHLPQYLSFLFSGKLVSEYTSIGCHTALWDYQKRAYHRWVYAEGIEKKLAAIQPTTQTFQQNIEGIHMKIGPGIHDSSAALIPYLKKSSEPFMLLSTGSWNIVLNPFNQEALTTEELRMDCLNFIQIDGQAVKASRLFLGNEYKIWTKKLAKHFQKYPGIHKQMNPQSDILNKLEYLPEQVYAWESITTYPSSISTDLSLFPDYETAYHKLMQELVELQIRALHLAKGKTSIQKLYVDGGFIDNELFLLLLAKGLPQLEILPAHNPIGSALGAAMVL